MALTGGARFRYGTNMTNILDDLKQRLLKRIEIVEGPLDTSCWEWQGSTVTGGYGNLTFRCESIYAHRASWIVHRGPIPIELKVLHRCDNRPCINPEHLFLGTQAINLQDMVNKGRDALRNRAILTETQVQEIKELLQNGVYSQREIGEIYSVSRSAILGIHLGYNWKHIA